ncbi:MAG: glutamate 5-kinase [Pirellulales bacterium]|jgi:glutamate 5-kinase
MFRPQMPVAIREQIAHRSRIVVVKVGTRVLTGPDGLLDQHRIASLSRQIDGVLSSGRQLVLVSSGAVAAGMGRLGLTRRPRALADLQAVAAIGQSLLVESYERALREHRRHAAQVLLVADDLHDRRRYLNIRNTLRTILDHKAVPVVNENDTVSVEELRTSFGDNDHLAAQVATLLPAELLILLSDVPGLFDRAPSNPEARLIPHVAGVDRSVESLAHDRLGGISKGGMASKISAARMITEAGGNCVIASGRDDDVLTRIFAGDEVGTLFTTCGDPMPAWKRWLGWSADCRGTLLVDAGARDALVHRGSSLLAAGVQGVEGSFACGDLVRVAAVSSSSGPPEPFARGLVNYTAAEVRQIAGLKTEKISDVLGTFPYEEVIHRDNLSVIRRESSEPSPATTDSNHPPNTSV